jgi:hypothetical protein
MASRRNRQMRSSDKREITLMTILANEATADSRKLLKAYGKPDAKNHIDLEQKLAELYFNSTDKVQIEKEMAAIHPHKKWLEKYIKPEEKVVETKVEETTSNADGCSCDYCREQRKAYNRASCPCAMNRNWERMSNVEGITETNQQKLSAIDLVGPIGLVGILAIAFIIIHKTT